MMNFSRSVAFIAAIITVHLQRVQSQSPFIISDDRVRSLDIAPVLGRGYSIMTNTFQSTCLIVEQTTIPSFNYDYFFTDFTTSETSANTLGGSIDGSFSSGAVSGSVQAAMEKSESSESQSHVISATMKIERYYSSVREEVSPLAADAFTLLETQDYIGFFKACGPNYVRSLRRAQEVTAIFNFETTSSESAMSFSASLKATTKVGGGGASVNASNKNKSAESSLSIKILGFGMGLTQGGSETMVATTLEEYQGVMKFAFKSMTISDDAHNIGMVYGMEVVPWVNNLAFQVAAKVAEENIIITLPRELMQQAYLKPVAPGDTPSPTPAAGAVVFTDNSGTAADPVAGSTRSLFRCKDNNPAYIKIDKYGYCCEAEQLFNPVTGTYSEPAIPCPLEICVCKPVQNLDKALVKDNMANNGEFVSRLDMAMRYKLASLGSLEKCISAARAFSNSSYRNNVLKMNDAVKYDKAIRITITLGQLKKAIDPFDDYAMVKQMAREMDEWIEMYYSPCIFALYGMNSGTTPETDVSLFMAYPWYSHPECMKISCLMTNMRWDGYLNRCVPSMITGSASAGYEDPAIAINAANGNTNEQLNSNPNCKKDEEDKTSVLQTCKYKLDWQVLFRNKVVDCWDLVFGGSAGIDHMINYYCNPVVTEVVVDTVPNPDYATMDLYWAAIDLSCVNTQVTGSPTSGA